MQYSVDVAGLLGFWDDGYIFLGEHFPRLELDLISHCWLFKSYGYPGYLRDPTYTD